MNTQEEIEIKDNATLPKYLYHLVPERLFSQFSDSEGNYDCRNKEEWGRNSSFIHTSPTKKQLKERVADMNWVDCPIKETFLLLEIDSKKLNTKVTYTVVNGYTYHHIWGKLPKDSFKTFKVDRSKDGKFLI